MPSLDTDTIPGQGGVSRRLFMQCCAAIVLAAPGCTGLTTRTRAAYTFLNDPPLEAYEPVLDALIAAVLPCERADFPLAAGDVRARLLTIFRLEADSRFVAVQKMLLYFDQTDLFQYAPPRLTEEETEDVVERRGDHDALVAGKEAADRRMFAEFTRSGVAGETFGRLSVARRRAYLSLWNRSEFLVRRQFHSSARALIMITAYSMDAVWPSIGYQGPIVPKSLA